MIQIKLPIVFSKKMIPEIVDQMIADERLQELLKTNNLCIRMYDEWCRIIGPLGYFVTDPSKPHAKVISIDKTDNGYFCDITIPTQYEEEFKCYENPIVHPLCAYPEEGESQFRIVFFKMYEINNIIKDAFYDGVNYEEEVK